ncbi:hypothetical protein LJC68_04415 [Bacteroidales bacterium OttesenSCG-928-B11]|nr:hypothetical protein [Bacteroidales bacterium OttesenSCG-928-C03]MDL2312102.1 hypothetical protein [Bacteroidales bacterium OttesenSCG-928-B11]MDL2326075.1 hypothetical protein [Bacteroidales bacterium OttesenSCG-928-A14]
MAEIFSFGEIVQAHILAESNEANGKIIIKL